MQLPDRSLERRREERFDRRIRRDYERLAHVLSEKGEALPAEPSVELLWSLSQTYGIDLDLLMNGKLDIPLFRSQLSGAHQRLPERYSIPEQMLSRGRAVLTAIDSIQTYLSENVCQNILRRLQISPARQFNPDEFVSMNLIVDLLQEVRRLGLSDQDMRQLGLRSSIVHQDHELGHALRRMKNGEEIYRAIHEEYLHFFDKNWNYRIHRMSTNSVDVMITLREETKNAFRSHHVGSRQGCLFRQGIYASMTMQSLGKPARISESRCMHVEGDHCLYHLNWD